MSDEEAIRRANRPSPEVIREFMDRGTLWLLEDPANAGDLLRIVEPELAARLDFGLAERINRSFVPADLQKRESDLIFRVPYREAGTAEAREIWVYLLLEHQSKPDVEMPFRLLLYMVQLWELQRRAWEDRGMPIGERRLLPIVPLVFYTGDAPWETPLQLWEQMDLPEELRRFVPGWETLRLNVKQTDAEVLVRLPSVVGWALRVMQEERGTFEDFERTVLEALDGIENLRSVQSGQWLRVVWYLVLFSFHRRGAGEYNALERKIRDESQGSRFYLREEGEVMAMTMAEVCEARGEARGEARELVMGLQKSLVRLLESKFGPLPQEARAQIEAANADVLDQWYEAALAATTLEQVGIRMP